MESNDRDDGAAEDPDAHHNRDFEPLPPAPLPAHERTWRHPSELGANTVELRPAHQPGISRRATVATVAAGVLLVVGAIRLMSPSSSSSSAGGVTVLTVGATISDTTSLQRTTMVLEAPATSLTATATLLATTTLVTHLSAPTTAAPQLDDPTVGDDPTAYAVVLGDGRFLATTQSAVGQVDAVDVHLPSGDTVTAAVVRSEGPIVLLDLSGVSAPVGEHGDTPAPGDVVTVGAPDGGAPASVGDANEHGYPQLVSDLPLHDSGPVYDAEGALVGICAHGVDERDWLVPVGMLDEMVDDHDGDVTTSAPPASNPQGATSTPATEVTVSASPTTATATTVVTTSSASTSTPKSWSTTSAPKLSSSTSTPAATTTTIG